MMGKRLFAVALAAAMLSIAGCEYTRDVTRNRETQTGAALGALAGAGLGAVVGHQSGDTGKGALIGGTAGALLGGGVGYALENQRKRFERELDDVRVEQGSYRGQETIVLTMSNTVLFPYDSAELMSGARNTLSEIAYILMDPAYPPPSRVIITGHTDSDGSNAYNMDLSQRRANSVRNYLVRQGLEPSSLVAIGAGEEEPAVPNTSLENKAMNRRVEIEVIP